MKLYNIKDYVSLALVILVCSLSLFFQGNDAGSDILRFHVRADNDTATAQMLKLKVRDAILEFLSDKLSQCESFDETANMVKENIAEIEDVANAVLCRCGSTDTATAYITCEWFPIKQYGDILLQCGKYNALRVDIGKHQGRNWWCMLYPRLCFVDESYMVTDGNEVKVRFKYLTFLNKYLD